jgi:hypothetical protein
VVQVPSHETDPQFTLNVFGKAGLGEDWPWESKSSKDGQSECTSFRTDTVMFEPIAALMVQVSLYESIARFECTAPAQMLLPLKVMQYSPLKRYEPLSYGLASKSS